MGLGVPLLLLLSSLLVDVSVASSSSRPLSLKRTAVGKKRHRIDPYLSGCALAGAISTCATHTAALPLDVVKTKMQADAALAAVGTRKALGVVLEKEGIVGLFAGGSANALGYFTQGAIKFGLYETGKRYSARLVDRHFGEGTARRHRIPLWMLSSACAEVVACVALCPFEATKIRMVTNPAYARHAGACLCRIMREEGMGAPYRGIFPIMMRQVPYTVAKLVGYEALASWGRHPDASPVNVRLGTGVVPGIIAGASAALVSQPGDVILARMCGSSKAARLDQCFLTFGAALRSVPLSKLFVGLQPRAVMCATICAGQFFLYEHLRPKQTKPQH